MREEGNGAMVDQHLRAVRHKNGQRRDERRMRAKDERSSTKRAQMRD